MAYGRRMTTLTCIFCGKPATHLADSDSIQWQDGTPVCDDDFDGDEHEERII